MSNSATYWSETWLSLGLAFIGGYADAASYTLIGTFTGHITGNSILGAISLASGDWLFTLNRLLAVIAFLLGLPLSSVVNLAGQTKFLKVSVRRCALFRSSLVLQCCWS